MDLYIIRHAWAADRGDSQWPSDDVRPLTEEGKKRFAALAAKLADRGLAPEIIATSPLVRCVETAQILAAAVGDLKVVEVEQLLPDGNADGLMKWTIRQARDYQRIAWVGHAPDVNWLAAAMIGQSTGQIRFAKGSVAALRFDGPPSYGSGELQWLVTAKVMGV